MRPSNALNVYRKQIREIIESHHAKNPRVFGSVLHESDEEGSDLDILIEPTQQTTLFDIGAMRHELIVLLGVPVDILTPRAIPEKFRNKVLLEAKAI